MMENKTKIDLKNKSIFITGVAGFIGSNLAKRYASWVQNVVRQFGPYPAWA